MQQQLSFPPGLCVDLFAGGGGASLGLKRAYRDPDIAVNHDPVAIAVHRANHPTTQHYTCDVFEIDPRIATQGRPIGVLWASPDCRHHSKAAGRKPRSKRVRGLAWVVTKWARHRPRLIHLENVEEFADWGPLLPDGQPCQVRKGRTFQRWKRTLEAMGYVVEVREIVAANFGAPTTRKRLYVIARCDGEAIVWPDYTHAKLATPNAATLPWRTAAECIDWTIPACSIFATKAEARAWAQAIGSKGTPKRPIVDATKRRIAKGLWRYSLAHPNPYIVPLRGSAADHRGTHDSASPLSVVSAGGTHHAVTQPHVVKFRGDSVGHAADSPAPTITAGGDLKRDAGNSHKLGIATAYVTPILTEHANASKQGVWSVDEPLRTQMAQVKGGHFAMATGALVPRYGEREGQEPRAIDVQVPMPTIVPTSNQGALAMAHLAQAAGGPNSNDSRPRDTREPLSTITVKGSQQQLVTAYLVKSYSHGGQWSAAGAPLGAITTKDRMGLVEVVHVPASIIAPELLERARQCAAFLHEFLPEQFPTLADLVLVGDYVLADITLRMLTPRELARAQGFPDSYVIEWGLFDDPANPGAYVRKPITKTQQVRLIGNSVCPDVAEALVRAQGHDPWRVEEPAARYRKVA